MPVLEQPAESPFRPRTSVRFAGVGTAVPGFEATQADVLSFVENSLSLAPATRRLYRRVLAHPSIETRRFAVSRLDELAESDPDRVARRFEKEGTALGARALSSALAKTGIRAEDVDFLAVTTCTGYLCPGLSAHVAAAVGLRADCTILDIVGMGCGAAIPALHQAELYVRANPGATAAVIAVELSSAAFFSNDAPDIVISNALFSDGAASAILRSGAANGGTGPKLTAFRTLTEPAWRDELRFRSESGRLRNVLGIDVPRHASALIAKLIESAPESRDATSLDWRWVAHAGGSKVLDELESAFGLDARRLRSARSVLRRHGNMSSATVLFAWEEEMRERPLQPGERALLLSFGAGFSAHLAVLEA